MGEIPDRSRPLLVAALQLGDAVHHLRAGGLRRRQGLERAHRARRLVEDAEVGERAADIHPDPVSGSQFIPVHLREALNCRSKAPSAPETFTRSDDHPAGLGNIGDGREALCDSTAAQDAGLPLAGAGGGDATNPTVDEEAQDRVGRQQGGLG